MKKLLKDVELHKDLAGSEGLDANNISRVRIQYLIAQHQTSIQQVQFADAKAAVIMTMIGFLALRGPIDLSNSQMGGVSIAFGIMCAVAVFCSISAVFPRYPSLSVSKKISEFETWSWPALSCLGTDPDNYAEYMQTSEVSQLVHSISSSNVVIARVLRRKFMYLRLSFFASGISVLLIFADLSTKT